MFSSPSWRRLIPYADFDAGGVCICSTTEVNLSRMSIAISFWRDILLLFSKSDMNPSRENFLSPILTKLCTGDEPSAQKKNYEEKSTMVHTV